MTKGEQNLNDFYLVLLHAGPGAGPQHHWEAKLTCVRRVKRSSSWAQVGGKEDGEKPSKGGFRKLVNGSVMFLLSSASCGGGGGVPAVASSTPHSCDSIHPGSLGVEVP